MIHLDDDDALMEDDRQAVGASREYFRRNSNAGIPFEHLIAECGFTMDQLRDYNHGR